jgi:hypothetical protein
MSWSVQCQGPKEAVKAEVARGLTRYADQYEASSILAADSTAAESNRQEAEQVRQARDLILDQIDRTPGDTVQVEACGHHYIDGSGGSNVKIEVKPPYPAHVAPV